MIEAQGNVIPFPNVKKQQPLTVDAAQAVANAQAAGEALCATHLAVYKGPAIAIADLFTGEV